MTIEKLQISKSSVRHVMLDATGTMIAFLSALQAQSTGSASPPGKPGNGKHRRSMSSEESSEGDFKSAV